MIIEQQISRIVFIKDDNYGVYIMPLSYHEQEDKKIYLKLKELLKELPLFCTAFFRGIEPRTQSRTRLAYAYDLGIFFHFLKETNPLYKNSEIRYLDISVMDSVNARDIE